MEHIYAVRTSRELMEYQKFVEEIHPRLLAYIEFLKQEYGVFDLPKTIVWTSREIATSLISDIPIPAFTNDFRIVMTPDLDAWRSIYLAQLLHIEQHERYSELYSYYTNEISINHILQILGHELAHHIPLFLDDFDASLSNGIWFEEGMVEYISRNYFLTTEQYNKEHEINLALVDALKNNYGTHSLESFGASTYAGDFASIYYEYWRSYLTIHQIVNNHHGDIHKVFASYRNWYTKRSEISLLDWFGVKL